MSYVPKFIELPSGIKFDYVEQGRSSSVSMLLLHGVTDCWRSFERVLPHLPSTIRIVAVSQRGHGNTDHPASGYRTRDFAADIADLVRTLDLGPCVVVGHSMGSTNALRFAIDYPDLARALVLVGCFASYRRSPVIAEFWQTVVSRLEDPIDPAFVREFQQSTLANPIPEMFLAARVEESLRVPASVWRAAFAGFLEDDFTSELHRVSAPTLLLWGDRDGFCPRADQDMLLRAMRDCCLLVYEGTGHAPHWEQPERFAADIAAFVESLAVSSRRLAGFGNRP